MKGNRKKYLSLQVNIFVQITLLRICYSTTTNGKFNYQFKIGLKEKSTLSMPQFIVSALWPMKYFKTAA